MSEEPKIQRNEGRSTGGAVPPVEVLCYLEPAIQVANEPRLQPWVQTLIGFSIPVAAVTIGDFLSSVTDGPRMRAAIWTLLAVTVIVSVRQLEVGYRWTFTGLGCALFCAAALVAFCGGLAFFIFR